MLQVYLSDGKKQQRWSFGVVTFVVDLFLFKLD